VGEATTAVTTTGVVVGATAAGAVVAVATGALVVGVAAGVASGVAVLRKVVAGAAVGATVGGAVVPAHDISSSDTRPHAVTATPPLALPRAPTILTAPYEPPADVGVYTVAGDNP
jgi:hypothetical protein